MHKDEPVLSTDPTSPLKVRRAKLSNTGSQVAFLHFATSWFPCNPLVVQREELAKYSAKFFPNFLFTFFQTRKKSVRPPRRNGQNMLKIHGVNYARKAEVVQPDLLSDYFMHLFIITERGAK